MCINAIFVQHSMLIFSLQSLSLFFSIFLSNINIFFSQIRWYIELATYDIQDEVAPPDEISQTQHQFYEHECINV